METPRKEFQSPINKMLLDKSNFKTSWCAKYLINVKKGSHIVPASNFHNIQGGSTIFPTSNSSLVGVLIPRIHTLRPKY